jgi:hypothetical protein
MKSVANAPEGLFQVSHPLFVFTPPARYWYRYFHDTPDVVIHEMSDGELARPNSSRLGVNTVAATPAGRDAWPGHAQALALISSARTRAAFQGSGTRDDLAPVETQLDRLSRSTAKTCSRYPDGIRVLPTARVAVFGAMG